MPNQFDKIIDRRIIDERMEQECGISAEQMKQIIKQTMGKISEDFDTKNFMRWMKSRDLAKSVRKLVVRVCKDLPTEGQYRPENNDVLIKGVRSNEDAKMIENVDPTLVHEFLHYISMRGETQHWNQFLNEGITGYLTRSVGNKDIRSFYGGYTRSQGIISLLHKAVGDNLIRTYLLGKPEAITGDIERLIKTDNPTCNSGKITQNFLVSLNVLHSLFYNRERVDAILIEYHNGDEEEVKKFKVDFLAQIASTLRNIAMGAVKEKIENLEFYNNGVLDINLYVEYVNNIATATFLADRDIKDMSLDKVTALEFKKSFIDEATSFLMAHSHVWPSKTPDEKKVMLERKSFSKNDLKVKDTVGLLKAQLMGKKDIGLNEYMDILSKVRQATNSQMPDIIDIALSNIPTLNDVSQEDASKVIKNIFPIYATLERMQMERKKDTVDSIFYKLPDSLIKEDEHVYIERRDRGFYYIRIDGKTGTVHEEPIKKIGGILISDSSVTNLPYFRIKRELLADITEDKELFSNENGDTDTLRILGHNGRTDILLTFLEDENEIVERTKNGINKINGKGLEDIKSDFVDESLSSIYQDRKQMIEKLPILDANEFRNSAITATEQSVRASAIKYQEEKIATVQKEYQRGREVPESSVEKE